MVKAGEKAPEFGGIDQNGAEVSLASLAGKKIVLYFYPKDHTPGCTAEACSLRDGYADLLRMGFVVVGVSPDTGKSHQSFAEKHALPYSLLSDPEKELAEAYGVWGEKKFMGKTYMGILRTTFIIDENGRIEHIIDKVKTKDHFRQIADLYR